jgi:hypothetical protein
MPYFEIALKTIVVVESASIEAAKALAWEKIASSKDTMMRYMTTREVIKPCLGGFAR